MELSHNDIRIIGAFKQVLKKLESSEKAVVKPKRESKRQAIQNIKDLIK